ncbi:MAG TPA: hypothetical protein VL501_06780 [Pyrinomonadaceae bacterium]|nr:hypothetical protein [Pyrinomonadaceae bacterium]
MTRSRPQNSLLAVATLGVYLGLILAGGAPSVLAQAATAKQFNVKDEVEYADRLNRKPSGADTAADQKLNAKIDSSVRRLISKFRAASSTTSSIVVFETAVAIVPTSIEAPIQRHRAASRSSLTDLIGPQNLARAGIA